MKVYQPIYPVNQWIVSDELVVFKDQRAGRIEQSEEVRETKSESDRTYCYIGKFNITLSLYKVLGIALYFSQSFLKAAVRRLAVAEAL